MILFWFVRMVRCEAGGFFVGVVRVSFLEEFWVRGCSVNKVKLLLL